MKDRYELIDSIVRHFNLSTDQQKEKMLRESLRHYGDLELAAWNHELNIEAIQKVA
jgi:hypothetical protein